MTSTIAALDPAARSLAARGVAFAPQIAGAAEKYGLDPRLLAAIAAQETGGPGSNSGRNVVGDGGHGHGIFQIDDRFHDFAKTGAAMNPQANADYAAGMIAGLLKQYGGDVHKALSAYNAGKHFLRRAATSKQTSTRCLRSPQASARRFPRHRRLRSRKHGAGGKRITRTSRRSSTATPLASDAFERDSSVNRFQRSMS